MARTYEVHTTDGETSLVKASAYEVDGGVIVFTRWDVETGRPTVAAGFPVANVRLFREVEA